MKSLKEARVYVYCDPRHSNNNQGHQYQFEGGILRLKYKPFYIGCAGYNNHLRHLTGNKSSEYIQRRIKKIREKNLEPIIKVLKVYEDRKKALKLEEILIIAIGRQDLKTGPLLNRLDGRRNSSPEVSRRKSEKAKRKWGDFEYREKMTDMFRNQGKNPEFRKKISKANKKKWQDPEYRKHISEVHEGENSSRAKLTEKKVLKIRQLKEKGWSFLDLAEKYKVSRSCIHHIVRRHSWTHI